MLGMLALSLQSTVGRDSGANRRTKIWSGASTREALSALGTGWDRLPEIAEKEAQTDVCGVQAVRLSEGKPQDEGRGSADCCLSH